MKNKLKNIKQNNKKEEPKESMGADASGSYEGPFVTNDKTVILKKDIHNWKSKPSEVKEITGADVSAGAMYDAPPKGLGSKDPLKIDSPRTASITASPNTKMKATQKGFPKFGGPDAKFVEIDKRCKEYPYCNQGDDNQIKLREDLAVQIYESKEVQNAIRESAKKYGLPLKKVKKMVIKEILSEALPSGMFDDIGNLKALRTWTDKGVKIMYHLTTDEPLDIKTDDDIELAKLKLILYNHDISFNVNKSIK